MTIEDKDLLIANSTNTAGVLILLTIVSTSSSIGAAELMVVAVGCCKIVGKRQSKITKIGSRHTFYLEIASLEDSPFPFKPDHRISIDDTGFIVEKA